MIGMRRQYEGAFKAKVALEGLKGEKTIAQLDSETGVHPNQVRQWKQHLLGALPEAFSNRKPREEKASEEMVAELYRQIGQLKVELDWPKRRSQSLLS